MSALREIIASFGVSFDAGELDKGNKKVEAGISLVGKLAGAVGAYLALGHVKHFVEGLFESADALNKQARVMGMSLGELQKWNYAADLAGVSADQLRGTFAKLAGGKGSKGLAALGIATKNANGELRPTPEILLDVADKLKGITNPAERNRKAMAVLGKSYASMLPLLEGGKEGLEELFDEFEASGGGFTGQFGDDAEEFNDNLTRMKTLWTNVAITIVGRILPTLLHLSKRFIELAKPVAKMLRHGKLLEAVFGGLALKGVLRLSKALGPLGRHLKDLGKSLLRTVLPLLILEDFLVFLAGGKSAIGATLDKIFGKGTGEKIRQWIFGVKKEFLIFIDEVRNKPQKIYDDWILFQNQLRKDFGTGWQTMIGDAGNVLLAIIGFFTGGVSSMWDKIKALGASVVLIVKMLSQEWWLALYGVGANIQDFFAKVWNSIILGFQNVVAVWKKGFDLLPGGGAVAGKLGDLVNSLESAKGAGDAGLRAAAFAQQQRLALANQAEALGDRLTAGAPVLTVKNETNVTVPPGTPADVAKGVAKAAEAGASKANRKTAAALHHGKG